MPADHALQQNSPFCLRGLRGVDELKILIAEDNKFLGNLLSRTLSKVEGFKVVGADIERLSKSVTAQLPPAETVTT